MPLPTLPNRTEHTQMENRTMKTVFIVTVRDCVLDVVMAFAGECPPSDERIVEAYNDIMESDIEDIYDLEVLNIVETVIYS